MQKTAVHEPLPKELEPLPQEFSSITIKENDADLLKIDIFAVIPAFNNAKTIGSVIILAKKQVGSVIVVDDGSTDDTEEVAKYSGAQVIRLDHSTGRSYALLLGLLRAREQKCSVAVCIDAEGSYDLRDVDRLIGKIASHEADLVIGSRYLSAGKPKYSFEKFDEIRLGSGMVITDLTSSLLAFNKSALDNLDFQSDGFKLNRDLIPAFDKMGFKISEVPVRYSKKPADHFNWGYPLKVLAGMPAFNEEKFIAKTILGAQKYVDQVLVIDDGSTDATSEIAENLGAIVVRHEKNRGYGAAIRSIFEKAKDLHVDALVIIDADGQHNPSDIDPLLDRLAQGDVDVVIGSRFVGKKQDIPRYRVFGMKVLDYFTSFAGAERNIDSQSGFRAYGKKAINAIRISGDGMSVGSEILIKIAENQLKIAEVPINVRYDIEDTSSQNPVSHGVSVVYNIIGLVSYKRPLLAFGIPGAVLVIFGFLTSFNAFSEYYATTKFPYALSMISLVSLIAGLLFLIAALILNYLVVFVKDQRLAKV